MHHFARLTHPAAFIVLFSALVAMEPQTAPAPASQPAAKLDEREQAIVNWVRRNAVRLATVEAGNDLTDIRPLAEALAEARVISLGESTHGTREIFQMKHRVLEALVREQGLTLFGIEASLPDCIPINEYVLHGRGDPVAAVAGQGFWTWNTEEVVDLVKWMRAYNVDPTNAAKPKLKFYGFDMQNPSSAVDVATRYLRDVDVAAAEQVQKRINSDVLQFRPDLKVSSDDVERTRAALGELEQLYDRHASALTQRIGPDRYAIGRRCVTVAQQGIELIAEARQQNTSPQRQQLFMRIPGQVRDLARFVDAHAAAFDMDARALLDEAADIERFAMRYMAPSTSDEQRQAWARAAASLKKAVDTIDESPAADEASRMGSAQAADLVAFLEALSELPRDGGAGRVNIRDRSMAENVRWILEHEGPASRIVLWSHNGHANVGRGDPDHVFSPMGSYLEKWFGDDHVAIGFSFGRGSFQAVPARPGIAPADSVGLPEWNVDWAKPGSVDATLAAAGIPIFFLDLRPALEAGGTVADWLSTAHPWRMAGAVYDPGAADAFYRTQAPGEAFEGLIYIQDTTRARPSGVAAFADLNPGDRPRLGVQVRQADDDEPGVIIQSIIAHTPAEEAGLNSGDRLLEIDGRVIRSANDIQTALGGHEAGTVVHALVLRESRRMEIPIRLSSPSTRPAR